MSQRGGESDPAPLQGGANAHAPMLGVSGLAPRLGCASHHAANHAAPSLRGADAGCDSGFVFWLGCANHPAPSLRGADAAGCDDELAHLLHGRAMVPAAQVAQVAQVAAVAGLQAKGPPTQVVAAQVVGAQAKAPDQTVQLPARYLLRAWRRIASPP